MLNNNNENLLSFKNIINNSENRNRDENMNHFFDSYNNTSMALEASKRNTIPYNETQNVGDINTNMYSHNNTNNSISGNNGSNSNCNQGNKVGVENKTEQLEMFVENMLNELKSKMQNLSNNLLSKVDSMEKSLDDLENIMIDFSNKRNS
ncbi:heat shock factor-binding protein 1 [Plasmodium brasilianum]|nr:heat shock factor-binding protein 1 [Plasmodium brasilianum]SBT01211.1 heat shock factor-binding protein 1, putative (HSBP) [Plasmodium malariae]